MEIPGDLRQTIDSELESNEQIQWMEMRIPRLLTFARILQLLAGIGVTGFFMFFTCAACGFRMPHFRNFHPGHFFALFGVVGCLVALRMLTAPFRTYWKERHTVYVITDRRAIAFYGGGRTAIRSYTGRNHQDVHRGENGDGSGDVIIGCTASDDDGLDQLKGVGFLGLEEPEWLGFLGIREPKRAENLLRRLAEPIAVERRLPDGRLDA